MDHATALRVGYRREQSELAELIEQVRAALDEHGRAALLSTPQFHYGFRGDLDSARRNLIQAGASLGSPQLIEARDEADARAVARVGEARR